MGKYIIDPYDEDDIKTDFRKEDAYIRAKKKVEAMVGFYWHLTAYLAVNLFLILIIALNTDDGFLDFAPYATASFWGIGLFFHFIGVFGFNFFLGKNWEQRKIDEFMENEQKHWE
jgi:hypothetical protein